jgi:hypothetical protein
MDPDPDPGGPKTCGSGGSGFGSGSATLIPVEQMFETRSKNISRHHMARDQEPNIPEII